MDELTQMQRRVFEFVRDNLSGGGLAPTPREIAASFGWRSKRAAECHIGALIRKGWLTSEPGKARSLRPADSAQTRSRAAFDLPVLGTIPAGLGDEREQGDGECVPVTSGCIGFKPTPNTFALWVSGDSMVGRHICDGDLVVLERGPVPRPGQVVAALIDRKSTLKTFVMKNGKPFLKAENPKYPNLIPSEELLIQGVMYALIRQIRS
jgi:repressor LexA